MTARLSPQREAEIVEQIKQALSEAGAFCGECGFEPGDRGCRDCEACWKRYADDLLPIVRKAAAAELAEAQLRVDEVERRYTFDTADLRRTVDHHKGGKERWRKRALEAEAMVYELKRPAIEQSRNEVRSSMIALAGEASADRDHEGAAAIEIDLEKYEAKWRREDEEMQARIGTPTKAEEVTS